MLLYKFLNVPWPPGKYAPMIKYWMKYEILDVKNLGRSMQSDGMFMFNKVSSEEEFSKVTVLSSGYVR